MATSRKQKEEQLKEMISLLKSAKGVVFAHYRGITVKQIDAIRKNLRKENVTYTVAKVTLLRKALAELGIDSAGLQYDGPIAIAASTDDETTPARLLKSMNKEYQFLTLASGMLDKKVIGKQMVATLADLPSKQQLLGQLVSVIAGPARGLVTVLTGNMRQLLYALNAIAEAKE